MVFHVGDSGQTLDAMAMPHSFPGTSAGTRTLIQDAGIVSGKLITMRPQCPQFNFNAIPNEPVTLLSC